MRREQRGIPTGGRFMALFRREPDVSLRRDTPTSVGHDLSVLNFGIGEDTAARKVIAADPATDPNALDFIATIEKDKDVQYALAGNPATPRETQWRLSESEFTGVRRTLLNRHDVDAALASRVANSTEREIASLSAPEGAGDALNGARMKAFELQELADEAYEVRDAARERQNETIE